MKIKKRWLLLLLITIQLPLFAQDGVLKAKDGKIFDSGSFLKHRYAMPMFGNGKIILKDKMTYNGKFNIDNCSQTLRMLDENGDTLTVASESLVVSMSAGSYLFYKIKNRYVQILDTDGQCSLGLTKQVTFGRKALTGAFGMTDDVAMMDNVVSTEDNFYYQIEKGLWSGSVPFNYREIVYIVNKGRLYPFTKLTLKKFFPGKVADIEKYIKEQKLDISKREDASLLYKFIIR